MRNIITRTLLVLAVFSLTACQALAKIDPRQEPAVATTALTVTVTAAPPELPTRTPVPTAVVTVSPTPFLPAIATPSQALSSEPLPTAQTPATETGFQLRWHPDGPLFAGDRLSLEVIAPAGEELSGKSLQVQVRTLAGEQSIGMADFAPYGLGGRLQATLWWFWDTSGLAARPYELTFTVLPEGQTWQETVTLLPAADLPVVEREASWTSVESQCCTLYYVTGSAAERDLAKLLAMVDEQASDASQKLGVQVTEKIPIVLLPRVLGHGGFTAQEIAVSYLDRNYAGSGTELTIHHEIVHWLDDKLGCDLRPSLLVEGLAVYLTGGHFKPEPLMARAATLLAPVSSTNDDPDAAGKPVETPTANALAYGLDRYIPLAELADNFYPSQHEIGYLEAGALVEYMVETWGWTAFVDFYRDIHSQPQPAESTLTTGGSPVSQTPYPSQSTAIEAALQDHFQLNLEELEQNFITALRQETLTPALVEDVRLSVDYFDTLRRYQQLLDPSAYYLYAWLADTVAMRQRGIVADYLRKPVEADNQSLELMFIEADTALRAGDNVRTAELLAAINAELDRILMELLFYK